MADYMVGKGGGGKDRYKVGWNESKSNAYKVGGGGSNPSQADNKNLGSGDQGSPAGQKSAFKYKDIDTKDVGDSSENMNFGGSQASGAGEGPTGAGGQIELSYSQTGGFGESKDAMARRKARMEGYKQAMGAGAGYDSPTVDLVNIKKG